MSFQEVPGSLAAGAPTGLEKLWDLIGIDIAKLINFTFVFGTALTFLHYVSRSMLSYLSYFTTSVRLDDDDPLYQRVLQWITEHHPPSPRLCSMRAISSDQSSVEEEVLLGSMKGREVKNKGKFISYRQLVEQPLIKLRPHAGKHLFRYNGKWIFFSHTEDPSLIIGTTDRPLDADDGLLDFIGRRCCRISDLKPDSEVLEGYNLTGTTSLIIVRNRPAKCCWDPNYYAIGATVG